MKIKNNKLYFKTHSAEDIVAQHGSPVYVYEEETIKKRYNELKQIPYKKINIHYACKANSNLHILKLLKSLGCKLETVSQGEVLQAFKAGFTAEDIMFTCSNITEQELVFLAKQKIIINTDSISQLKKIGKNAPGTSISLRFNTGIGVGHHKHVVTGGKKSKFGLNPNDVPEIKKIIATHNLTVVGVHHHIGSDSLDAEPLIKATKLLLQIANQFPDLQFVDFGSGFGVPYKPDQQKLNIVSFGKQIAEVFTIFCKDYGIYLTLIFEPGRYIIAEAGTLLVTVTDIKKMSDFFFVGVNSGCNHLIRPMMYGAYHSILNASIVDGNKITANIVGYICESGDAFAHKRKITQPQEGHILAIKCAGAYGFSMSSHYNARRKPAEILVQENGNLKVIRKRETFDQLLESL